MTKVLILDDDQALASLLKKIVEREGHSVEVAYTLEEGLQKLSEESYQVLFLDVVLPDGNGLEALPRIRELADPPEVVMITGHRNPEGAKLAITSGAWDYVVKPFSLRELKLTLKRVIQYRDVLDESRSPKILDLKGIIGSSPAMKQCFGFVARAASSAANVLITGETGTGKELFAWAIHNNSDRAAGRFVVVDCAAIPETLIESVLFGHVRGAYTGAETSREGLFKQAHGGTLFLDEIGELPLSIQSKLLRALESRRFRPIGSSAENFSDFRIISATNRDLAVMSEGGLFRQDLLHRLRVLSLGLPPLRDRSDDLFQLTTWYVRRHCTLNNRPVKGFSPDFFEKLALYPWPGNVRELFNAIESALVKAQHSPTIFPQHLPKGILVEIVRKTVDDTPSTPASPAREPLDRPPGTLKDFRNHILNEAERQYLSRLLAYTKGNVTKAASQAGVSRTYLHQLIKKHGM